MTNRDDVRAGRLLSSDDLRRPKVGRDEFLALRRRPITVVLDDICQNYNIGAIFRLCDGFLAERLIIGGAAVELHKRKLVQAARGTQGWVPWGYVENAVTAVAAAKAVGARVIVVEQTSAGVTPENLIASSPVCLVLGSERNGVSQEIIDMADAAVTIPLFGMTNSLNVATAAAIVLHRLSTQFECPQPSEYINPISAKVYDRF